MSLNGEQRLHKLRAPGSSTLGSCWWLATARCPQSRRLAGLTFSSGRQITVAVYKQRTCALCTVAGVQQLQQSEQSADSRPLSGLGACPITDVRDARLLAGADGGLRCGRVHNRFPTFQRQPFKPAGHRGLSPPSFLLIHFCSPFSPASSRWAVSVRTVALLGAHWQDRAAVQECHAVMQPKPTLLAALRLLLAAQCARSCSRVGWGGWKLPAFKCAGRPFVLCRHRKCCEPGAPPPGRLSCCWPARACWRRRRLWRCGRQTAAPAPLRAAARASALQVHSVERLGKS